MCGIAGIISLNGIRVIDLSLMSSALKHRGPDGYGYMLYSQQKGIRVSLNRDPSPEEGSYVSVGFAHRRLSIIDLSSGSSQPMMDDSGKYCAVYNGEIYNHLDLKQELRKLGHSFKTTGDTEVLLRAYEAWGPDCVKRFNGMWAFALLDVERQLVLLSRDRFGIKPLYFRVEGESVYFSSEIKGLLASSFFSPEPNEQTVAKYLLTGILDDTEETFFKGIFQFPAGHWAAISLTGESSRIRPVAYWAFPSESYSKGEQDAIHEFKELFLDSLRIHTQSDVPVGTCLSGGLDSSSIVCASELLRRSYHLPNFTHSAFGYCSSDERFLEKKYMDVVAESTSINLHYIEFTPEQFVESVPEIIRSQDEPFASASIVSQWFVFQRARAEGITVMLDGQGADETLAGYHTYFATIALNLLARRRVLSYLSLRSKYEKEIGKFPLPYFHYFLGTLSALIPLPPKNALRPIVRILRERKQRRAVGWNVFSPALSGQYQTSHKDGLSFHSLNKELQVQVRSSCLPALLRYEDRNSMAHSIESRVPFLDYRLVEFLFTLPEHWKINGVTTKYILREAMRGVLPETIRARKDKIGFNATPALTFQFASSHRDSLSRSETEYEKQWLKAEGVREALEARGQSPDFEFFLWRLLNLKLWLRQHWS